MIITILIVTIAFYWLLIETSYMRIRLEAYETIEQYDKRILASLEHVEMDNGYDNYDNEYYREAVKDAFMDYVQYEPASKLVRLVKTSGKRKGEISNLTIRQYKELTGKCYVPDTILTPDKQHVRWEYSLDDVASELGYQDGEHLRETIEYIAEARRAL